MLPALAGQPSLARDPWLLGSDWEQENALRLRRLALALVALGLVWRFSRYLMGLAIWGDEAMLLVNYFTKGYLDLCGHIDNCQVAPLLFHWIELTALRTLGSSELAMRLAPFLAGLGSVALFWRLAGLTLPPLGRTLAVGILSVSIWPATMGALAKPYAFDLFFSLTLLTPAVWWLQQPSRRAGLLILAAVTPLAVLGSYPSVFLGGAVSLALLPAVWRSSDRKTAALFALFNALLVGCFVGNYLLIARSHLASPVAGVTTGDGMAAYWADGFPPAGALAFLRWTFLAHTGQMAAYPVGASNGGSILTVVLVGIGVWGLARENRRLLLTLTAAAFGLWFFAAVLRRYPYGVSCRLAQHVAPFYCLLAGLGASIWIGRLHSLPGRWKASLGVCSVLAVVGVVGAIRDYVVPYREPAAVWVRQLAGEMRRRTGNELVLSTRPPELLPPLWHWQMFRPGSHVVSPPAIDWRQVARERSVWVWTTSDPNPQETAVLEAFLAQSGETWRCVEQTESVLHAKHPDEGALYSRTYHWVRTEGTKSADKGRLARE